MFIHTSRRYLNTDYLVMTEDLDNPEGSLRVTMVQGKEFDLSGPDADRVREGIEAVRSGASGGDRVVPSIDPKTGRLLPLRPPQDMKGA